MLQDLRHFSAHLLNRLSDFDQVLVGLAFFWLAGDKVKPGQEYIVLRNITMLTTLGGGGGPNIRVDRSSIVHNN